MARHNQSGIASTFRKVHELFGYRDGGPILGPIMSKTPKAVQHLPIMLGLSPTLSHSSHAREYTRSTSTAAYPLTAINAEPRVARNSSSQRLRSVTSAKLSRSCSPLLSCASFQVAER